MRARSQLERSRIGRPERYLYALKKEALRRGWGEPEWLFPSELGTRRDEANVRRAFRCILKRATLPAFRVYGLRHTSASLLPAACAPITY